TLVTNRHSQFVTGTGKCGKRVFILFVFISKDTTIDESDFEYSPPFAAFSNEGDELRVTISHERRRNARKC
ncbi:MAG: hypothetical protein Q4Q25_02770, partial [Methanocorpusculum sp.]|nr:hypothetical protein [Methanocorpusculum sp.]